MQHSDSSMGQNYLTTRTWYREVRYELEELKEKYKQLQSQFFCKKNKKVFKYFWWITKYAFFNFIQVFLLKFRYSLITSCLSATVDERMFHSFTFCTRGFRSVIVRYFWNMWAKALHERHVIITAPWTPESQKTFPYFPPNHAIKSKFIPWFPITTKMKQLPSPPCGRSVKSATQKTAYFSCQMISFNLRMIKLAVTLRCAPMMMLIPTFNHNCYYI
jgi:hypothetical protein